MRRLGRACGVEAMSLYAHVPSKDAVLDGVVDAVYADVALPDLPPGTPWDEELLALARAFRNALFRHPGALPAVSTRPGTGPAALRLADRVAGALLRGGFPPLHATYVANGLGVFVIGLALAAVGRTPFAAAVTPEQLEQRVSGIDAGTYPHLATVIAEVGLGECDWDELFEVVMGAFLVGLRARQRETTA